MGEDRQDMLLNKAVYRSSKSRQPPYLVIPHLFGKATATAPCTAIGLASSN